MAPWLRGQLMHEEQRGSGRQAQQLAAQAVSSCRPLPHASHPLRRKVGVECRLNLLNQRQHIVSLRLLVPLGAVLQGQGAGRGSIGSQKAAAVVVARSCRLMQILRAAEGRVCDLCTLGQAQRNRNRTPSPLPGWSRAQSGAQSRWRWRGWQPRRSALNRRRRAAALSDARSRDGSTDMPPAMRELQQWPFRSRTR